MVFKRYIYRNGKKFGPYYYSNKKVNGKVISTYMGTETPADYKKPGKRIIKQIPNNYLILAGVLILLAFTLVRLFILIQPAPTGEISVTLETPKQGEYLSGIVKISMKQGELIPASAIYVIDNVGERSEFPLSSLFSNEQVQGDFYMRGFDISGSGMGYGVIGEKTTYPEVEFTMKITKLKIEEEANITANQTPVNQTPTNQTSNVSNYSLITGKAISEEIIDVREVKGVVTAETPFTYELAQDEIAEILFSSQPVDLETQDNIATVTTDYIVAEPGFGEDYLGEENVEFSFDLEDLNLLAKQGELTVTLTYDNQELISTSKTINLGEEPPELGPPAPLDKSWWDSNYQYKRQLQITNNMASNLITGYSVGFTIDTTGTNFLDNGNDLRVVWDNAGVLIEIDRVNETNFDSTTTQIWFKLQQDIPSSSTDLNYYIYYGNPSAGLPPQNRKKVYLWFDDFNRPNNPDITSEADYSIKTKEGVWSIENNQLKNVGAGGDPNKLFITALGSNVFDVDMLTKINVNTWVVNSDAARMGLSQDMASDGGGYAALFHNDQNSLDLLNDLLSWGTLGTYSWTTNTWYNMRFRVIDPSARNGQVKVWLVGSLEPVSWTVDGNFGTGAARTNGYVGFAGSRQADITYFDDIQVRYIVSQEPTITILGESQNIPPSTPINIQCNGNDNCDITVDASVTLKALGSIDPDEDPVTYFLEAYLDTFACTNTGSCNSCGDSGQCSACSSAGCSWGSGGGVNAYQIFFEGMESGWDIVTNNNPPVLNCSNIGSFNGCNNNANDYEASASSYTLAVYSGSYGLFMEDWDTWGSRRGIWYSFNPSTACGGFGCDSIEFTYYWRDNGLDNNEYAIVLGDDDSQLGVQLNRCYGGSGLPACPTTFTKQTILLSNFLDKTDTNWNIRIGAQMSATNDEVYWDEFNITGYKTGTASCSGTLDCSQYLNQGTCETCNQCSWQTTKQWTEIGNHPEGSSFVWDTSSLPDQTNVNLRARAIDLTGSKTYSNYFTKNPTSPYLEILHGAASTCSDLNIPNTVYTLENDVSTTGTCFNVLADNITLNCQGYKITGDINNVSAQAVYSSGRFNTTIKNCNITNFYVGIALNNSANNGTIFNNTLYGNAKAGIGVYNNSKFVNITNNSVLYTYATFTMTGKQPSRRFCDLLDAEMEAGIIVCDSDNPTIERNFIKASGSSGINNHDGSEAGMAVITSKYAKMRYNTLYNAGDNFGFHIGNSSDYCEISYNFENGSASNGIPNTNDGIILAQSSNNCNILHNKIYSIDEWGIFLTSDYEYVYNNTANDNTPTDSWGVGIRAATSHSTIINNVFSNNIKGIRLEGVNNTVANNFFNSTFTGGNVCTGIYMLATSDSIPPSNNTFINNTVTTSYARCYGIHLDSGGYNSSGSGNVFINNNITTSNSDAIGIYLEKASNNTFINCNVKTLGNGAIGFYAGINSSFNNFIKGNITTTGAGLIGAHGVYFDSGTSNNFYDSFILASQVNDIYSRGSGVNNFTNTTFNKNNIYIESGSGRIYVKWYLDAYVDDTDGNDVNGANVTIKDKNDITYFNGTTDVNGNIKRQNLTEYFQNITGIYDVYNNYTIYAQNNSASDTESINFTGNRAGNNKVVLTLEEEANQPPTIPYVEPILPQSPIEAGVTSVVFSVRVYNANLVNDINDSSVTANFSRSSETTRTGNCSLKNDLPDGYTANYSCSVDMWYYDEAGIWIITIYAEDSSGASAINDTTNFQYLQLTAIKLSLISLSWPIVNPGATNQFPSQYTTINNTGNYEGLIYIKAYDLIGETNPSQLIPAANFSAGPISGSECSATQLQNSTSVPIISSSLPRGPTAQEEIYYCLRQVPYVSSQNYSSPQSWIMSM